MVAPVARRRDNSDVNVSDCAGSASSISACAQNSEASLRKDVPAQAIRSCWQARPRASQFAGLEIGNQVRLQDGDWTVVGTFAGGNGSRESEVVADALTVMSAYKLDAFNSMTVMLASTNKVTGLKEALTRDPTLLVEVRAEPEYLASAAGGVNRLLRRVAYAIGALMALGARFAALNSMHSAVAARKVEIATLRAIGFAPGAVAISVLTEALLLALLGAAIGVAIAYGAFNGTTISTLGGALWDSQLVYSLRITRPIAARVQSCSHARLGCSGVSFRQFVPASSNVADALHETPTLRSSRDPPGGSSCNRTSLTGRGARSRSVAGFFRLPDIPYSRTPGRISDRCDCSRGLSWLWKHHARSIFERRTMAKKCEPGVHVYIRRDLLRLIAWSSIATVFEHWTPSVAQAQTEGPNTPSTLSPFDAAAAENRDALNHSSNFRAIYADPRLAAAFFLFLKNVYNLYPEETFHQLIESSARSGRTDREIYALIQKQKHTIEPFLSQVRYGLPALARQKAEMARQSLEVLGPSPRINGYMEVGTTGRYVGKLQSSAEMIGRCSSGERHSAGYSATDLVEQGQLS